MKKVTNALNARDYKYLPLHTRQLSYCRSDQLDQAIGNWAGKWSGWSALIGLLHDYF